MHWRLSWSRCLGHRSWSCRNGSGLRFSQQAQQQHFKPQPGLSALAQLHFAAAQALLPAQQTRTPQLLGQSGQRFAIGGGEASELQMLWGR